MFKRPAFNVCVFCGSSAGSDERFLEAATQLGQTLAARGVGLVYGGGSVGLMGRVADACMEAGGHVEGVIPQGLFATEIGHYGLTRLHEVESMHARKALMASLSQAFVALPGGYGTLEELFEVTTWSQIGIHAKPVALWNVAGYYDRLLQFIDHAVAQGFISSAHRERLLAFDSLDPLLDALHKAPPATPALLTLEQS